jgi:outer membrane protein assembly factor BamE (lipoprotein component of BamABCDE complex)
VAGGTEKYLLKARWDRLETGMERDEVKVLLGHPTTVTRSAAGQVEVWGYGNSRINRYGVGTVYFDDDEEVATWISPTFKTN